MIPVELIILLKLAIFGVVCIANAYAIIAFNRATSYLTYDTDQHLGDGEGSVKMIPRGSIIPETKMILWRVKYWCEENLPAFWRKPIYACPTCMASLHGILPFLIAAYFVTGFTYITLAHWAFYTLTLSGYTTYLNER